MIQKKNLAARISDMEVVSEAISEDQSNNSTSPTSKATKVERSEVVKPEQSSLVASVPTHGLTLSEDSHHPQVIDQDVENFTTRLDTLICQFRNESLKEFLTVKRSILHEQISSIDNEKKRCNALVSSKQDEIQHLSEKLSSALKTCSQNECQKDALSLMVGTLKMRNWSLKLKTRSFLAWFSFHCRQVHKKKTSKLVEKLFRKSIINFVFLPWKASWKRFSMNKAQKRFNESLEAEKVSLAMHFNKEIEMLRKRLEDAENKIHNEEEAKVAIQENLKKAFMRGVCAMNFEAMNILNPESQGFNPNVLQPSGKIDFFENLQEKKQESPQTSPMKPSSDLIDLANFPAESKELKWKAAPVFGRPQTAQVISEPLPGLPMVTSSNNTEGKVIVVNNAKTEVKITGKVPVRPAVGKKK